MRKAMTIKIPWKPFDGAGTSTPRSATPMTKAGAQAMSAVFADLAARRAARRRW